jgi:hypothetical protein
LHDAEIAAHIRGDVQRRLGEEPKLDDAKDDTEEHTIIASVALGLAGY